MRGRIAIILGSVLISAAMAEKQCRRLTVTQSPQKRNSSKSKLKKTKPKSNIKYKSSKPIKAKASAQFRNKSHI